MAIGILPKLDPAKSQSAFLGVLLPSLRDGALQSEEQL